MPKPFLLLPSPRKSRRVENPRFASSSSSSTTTAIASPPNFKASEPKRFAIRPDKTWDIVAATLPLFLWLETVMFVSGYGDFLCVVFFFCYKVKETSKIGPRPEKPIETYEFEGYSSFLLPYKSDGTNVPLDTLTLPRHVKWVREIVSFLELDVLFSHRPRNGSNFRPKVAQMGGKQQFSYVVSYYFFPLVQSSLLSPSLSPAFFSFMGTVYSIKIASKPLEIWAFKLSSRQPKMADLTAHSSSLWTFKESYLLV
ncbi:hypothetical protein PTKIN_Ptkin06aG0060600 [Pterospermum kingtungense]